jgi:hypothetical protein
MTGFRKEQLALPREEHASSNFNGLPNSLVGKCFIPFNAARVRSPQPAPPVPQQKARRFLLGWAFCPAPMSPTNVPSRSVLQHSA